MRIPKIYRRTDPNNSSVTKHIVEVDKLPVINYVPEVDIDDDKSIEHYVKTIKMYIRTSDEYKRLMAFIKDKLNAGSCFFYPNIKKSRGSKVKIEMHHTGLVMDDIVRTVLRKRIGEGEDYDVASVANEVMYLHYKGYISLTPLSSTAHQLIHEEDGGLFIPLHMVSFGNIELFYDEYKPYILKDTIKKFDQYKLLSNTVRDIDSIIPSYLDRSYIYYKVKDDGIEIPSMERILEILNRD